MYDLYVISLRVVQYHRPRLERLRSAYAWVAWLRVPERMLQNHARQYRKWALPLLDAKILTIFSFPY